MCTAIHKNHLFGRTLDLECSLGEAITLTPRRYPLPFLHKPSNPCHLAFLGCAHLENGRAFYYDGVNEAGLAVAALNFPLSAHYDATRRASNCLASYEVIPALLSECRTLKEAKTLLTEICVTDEVATTQYSATATPLHWMVATESGSLVAEPVREGLRVYENPTDVLTNEPPFPYHQRRLCDFLFLSPSSPTNQFAPHLDLSPYSRGMGAMGLPGDFSSSSRFIRAAYARAHLQWESGEEAESFFHLLDTVSQPKGLSLTEQGLPVYTVYAACMDLRSPSYSYTTYADRSIRCRTLSSEEAAGDRLLWEPMK